MRNSHIFAVLFALLIVSNQAGAGGHEATTAKSVDVAQAEEELKKTFGTLPSWLMVYPEHARAQAWEWEKAIEGPGEIPPKYQQLIALAVASQIPCDYCTFVHRSFATEFFGASQGEISEAVALAANTRHWSTILYGNGIDQDAFRTEIRNIIEHMKAQSQESNAGQE
ncbi:MAG: alkylhydroperoxidase [Gemmatimonadetes bacterium]|nr:alkylhydroperoxidase [Gemmatimonadota bacterium]